MTVKDDFIQLVTEVTDEYRNAPFQPTDSTVDDISMDEQRLFVELLRKYLVSAATDNAAHNYAFVEHHYAMSVYQDEYVTDCEYVRQEILSRTVDKLELAFLQSVKDGLK